METPNLERYLSAEKNFLALVAFLKFARTEYGAEFCEFHDYGPHESYHEPIKASDEQVVAAYLELDLDAVEAEKQALLEAEIDKLRKGKNA